MRVKCWVVIETCRNEIRNIQYNFSQKEERKNKFNKIKSILDAVETYIITKYAIYNTILVKNKKDEGNNKLNKIK